jgi:ribonuclease-3
VAALYLGGGLAPVLGLVDRFLGEAFERAAAGTLDRDYKTHFQELSQSRLRVAPRYRVVAEHGPDHSKVFDVELELRGEVVGRGAGRSKKDAEQAAAKAALDTLQARDAAAPLPDPLPASRGEGAEGMPAPRGEGAEGMPASRGEGAEGMPAPRGEGAEGMPAPRGEGDSPSVRPEPFDIAQDSLRAAESKGPKRKRPAPKRAVRAQAQAQAKPPRRPAREGATRPGVVATRKRARKPAKK